MNAIEEKIQASASAIQANYTHLNKDIIVSVLRKTAQDRNSKRYYKGNELLMNDLNNDIRYFPNLWYALSFHHRNNHQAVLEYFDKSKMEEFSEKVNIVKDFSNIPFFTHTELSQIIDNFIKYLIENKKSLIYNGYPEKRFTDSDYLFETLGFLYPIKDPYDCEIDRDRTITYTWIRKNIIPSEEIVDLTKYQCCYEEAPFIDSLVGKAEEIQFMEESRAKLFNLKNRILKETQNYIKQINRDPNTLYNKFHLALLESFGRNDFEIFEIIDKYFHNHIDLQDKKKQVSRSVMIKRYAPNLKPGGIYDLLKFVCLIDYEKDHKIIHNIRDELLSKLKVDKNDLESYYQLVCYPNLKEIDKVIINWPNEIERINKYVHDITNNKIQKDFKSKKTPANPVSKFYGKLLRNLKTESDNIRAILSLSFSETPWEDIYIEIIDGQSIKIFLAGDEAIPLHFSCLFPEDKRGKKTTRQTDNKKIKAISSWKFLCKLAKDQYKFTQDMRDSNIDQRTFTKHDRENEYNPKTTNYFSKEEIESRKITEETICKIINEIHCKANDIYKLTEKYLNPTDRQTQLVKTFKRKYPSYNSAQYNLSYYIKRKKELSEKLIQFLGKDKKTKEDADPFYPVKKGIADYKTKFKIAYIDSNIQERKPIIEFPEDSKIPMSKKTEELVLSQKPNKKMYEK